MTSSLLLVFGIYGDETSHPLKIEQPAVSCADKVEPDDGRAGVRIKKSFRIEPCLGRSPLLCKKKKAARLKS